MDCCCTHSESERALGAAHNTGGGLEDVLASTKWDRAAPTQTSSRTQRHGHPPRLVAHTVSPQSSQPHEHPPHSKRPQW